MQLHAAPRLEALPKALTIFLFLFLLYLPVAFSIETSHSLNTNSESQSQTQLEAELDMSKQRPPVLNYTTHTYLALTLSPNSPYSHLTKTEAGPGAQELELQQHAQAIDLMIQVFPELSASSSEHAEQHPYDSNLNLHLQTHGQISNLPNTLLLSVPNDQWSDSKIRTGILRALKEDKTKGVLRVDVQVPKVREKRKRDEL